MNKLCPSCRETIDANIFVCPHCAWQISQPGTRSAGKGQNVTVVKGITRPGWINSMNGQLAVLVRDESGSMRGAKARDATLASQAFVAELAKPDNKDGFFVGVVDFAQSAEIAHEAIRATLLNGHVKDLSASIWGKSTNITDGLIKATTLISGFTLPTPMSALRPVVLLFSDGCHNEGVNPVSAAETVKNAADLVTIAYGEDADESMLRRLASTPDHFYRCSNGADLRHLMAMVGSTMTATMARGTNATQALSGIQ